MKNVVPIIFALMLPGAAWADIDEMRPLGYLDTRYHDADAINAVSMTTRAAPYISSILDLRPVGEPRQRANPHPDLPVELQTTEVPLPLPATLLLAGLSMLSFFSLRPRR